MPAGLALIDEMPEANAAAPVLECGRDPGHSGGNVAGMGRAADLVVDDADRVALAAQSQHGAYEIRAAWAENPGSAQDRVTRAGGLHCQFAGKLAAAIDAG